MPRKSKTSDIPADTVEGLVEELNTAAENISAAVGEEKPETPVAKTTRAKKIPDSEDTDKKRTELLKLASDGLISKSVAYINRASAKVIDKVYAEYEAKRLEKAKEFLTDQFISKFSAMMGGLDAIENPEEMEKELQRDPLVSRSTPWIPLLGLLSVGVTVAKHVWEHKSRQIGDAFARGGYPKEKPQDERSEEEKTEDTVN